jgi:hypothetical protein
MHSSDQDLVGETLACIPVARGFVSCACTKYCAHMHVDLFSAAHMEGLVIRLFLQTGVEG